jgi:hypothetical protein
MFLIRIISYLNIIFLVIAQSKHNDHGLLRFHDDDDPIIGILRNFMKNNLFFF